MSHSKKRPAPRSVQDQLSSLATKHGVPLDRLCEEWSERAAIRQYLGGLSRSAAEDAAIGDACDVLVLPAPKERP